MTLETHSLIQMKKGRSLPYNRDRLRLIADRSTILCDSQKRHTVFDISLCGQHRRPGFIGVCD